MVNLAFCFNLQAPFQATAFLIFSLNPLNYLSAQKWEYFYSGGNTFVQLI